MSLRTLVAACIAISLIAGGCSRKPQTVSASQEPALLAIPADRDADDLARFLAGLPGTPGSAFEPLERSADWKKHAAESDRLWRLFETERFYSMTEFQKTELRGKPVEGTTLFYPFGGPDALTPSTLFPNSSTYVLVGLEPPGTLPRWTQFHTEPLPNTLDRIRSTTVSLLSRSFFITAEMDRQLRGQITDGVLPVVLVQLVRSGHKVNGFEFVTLDEDGQIRPREEKDGHTNRGVAISFEGEADHQPRQLIYLSVNLATDRLSKNKGFLAYVSKLPRVTTFFKATSYMPHQPAFSLLRETVLKISGAVVQDDSGIPFKYFETSAWRVQLYGDYERPYGSFRYLEQKDLRLAYSKRTGVRKLTFPIGYGYKRAPSNLLVARRAG